MKFWQQVAWVEAEQLTELAKFAEELGFYGVLNVDHLFYAKTTESHYPYSADGKKNADTNSPYPDVWVSIAAMAAVTTRILLSSSVYILPLRSPVELAKVVGTAALISNNRVAVGFGVGWQKEEFDAMGVDFHTRGKRTDEMIEVMQKLWRGGVVSHHGRFFEFGEVLMTPVPTKPVPFYYGGTSPAALRRAATLCDGYVGPGHTVEAVPALIAELTRLRREAGRDHLPFEILLHIRPQEPPPDYDTLRRLEDMGVTSISTPPFFTAGVDRGKSGTGLALHSTIEEKKRVMERYAENVLRRMG